MNFISSGFQEVGRKFQRARDRSHLKKAQPRLDEAEIFLGQLGWQQVDFPPAIEQQIQAIVAVELQQTQFSNRSAGIQDNIDQLHSRREECRKEYDDTVSAVQAQLHPLLESRGRLAAPLAGLQQGVERFDMAIARLNDEYHSSAPLLEELKAIRPQTLQVKQELIRIEDMRIGYDAEKEDLQRARRKIIKEIEAATSRIGEIDAEIAELSKKTADAREEFNAKEEESVMMINSLQTDKHGTQLNIHNLDLKKSSSFLAIGRCLADANIYPRNQPESLQHVVEHRAIVSGYQNSIARSLEATAGASRVALLAFLVFVILFFAAAAFAVYMLAAPRHA